ncbi:fumarylacetoacetate hydrolase family protein [Thermopolyspora sp. NPDC052614]|uniref:fumarylacetoacetate hydrolase family protein n=1 Tax=Thermopolyspora sp. NPDC052614 TaxID=3155682 RepID=UPI0034445FA4
MKLATIRTADGTRAVKVDGHRLVDLGYDDLGRFLNRDDWAAAAASASGATYPLDGARFAPVVPQPSKVICVGLNYRSHIEEMGRDLPRYPVLFAKFADTLAGADDPVVKPAQTNEMDWECELAVVIGKHVRHATGAEAEAAIAGFSVLNDFSMRDYQFRTREWLQGKMWDSTTPVGPYVVTPDELPGGVRPSLDTRLTVDGVVKQTSNTSDLLFDPVHLVEYISAIVRLNPGDIIATGTNGGVGHARDQQEFLWGGETVVTTIQGIGTLTTRIVKDSAE